MSLVTVGGLDQRRTLVNAITFELMCHYTLYSVLQFSHRHWFNQIKHTSFSAESEFKYGLIILNLRSQSELHMHLIWPLEKTHIPRAHLKINF